MKNNRINLHSIAIATNVIVISLAIMMGFPVVAQDYNKGSISFSLDNDGLLGL